jgi:glycosyltransferase involved in cell wall biosynthesis
MTHLFINALSASAGGGLTYVRNVLPILSRRRDTRTTLLVGEALRKEFEGFKDLCVPKESGLASAGGRFCYEQLALPSLIRRARADVLLSTGNFALFRSPVPQILLSRNALYTSSDSDRDLRERGDYRLWMDTKIKGVLARWSVQAAECTVAPSETFAAVLRQWSGRSVAAIHHGFNRSGFFRDRVALPPDVEVTLAALQCDLRVLFVSHYNYYRNFETLIRAMAIVKKRIHPATLRLILTCKIQSEANPGSYQAESAAALIERLDLRQEVVELGAVPYPALHHLYRRCDVYATAAYAETFAHPLVEAMASGLPVVASDLPVHREICGPAAMYFPRFSFEQLAERIIHVSQSVQRKTEMRELGLSRSQDFSWDRHVEQLLGLARHLAKSASRL